MTDQQAWRAILWSIQSWCCWASQGHRTCLKKRDTCLGGEARCVDRFQLNIPGQNLKFGIRTYICTAVNVNCGTIGRWWKTNSQIPNSNYKNERCHEGRGMNAHNLLLGTWDGLNFRICCKVTDSWYRFYSSKCSTPVRPQVPLNSNHNWFFILQRTGIMQSVLLYKFQLKFD